MKSTMLILLALIMMFTGSWAADGVPVDNMWNIAVNQGVPAACMLALVVNHLFFEGPRQRALLEKILLKVDSCPYKGKE